MSRRKQPVMTLDGTVWLTVDGALLGGHHRIHLLRAVHAAGSITQAAKSVGLSYKAAWDAVDAMNNLAGAALVERSVGGRGGGHTALTERGLRLVRRYEEIEALHRRFLDLLGAGSIDPMADLHEDINLLRILNMKTSARNHFVGTVVALRTGAVNDEVELVVAGGHRIVATVTRESSESLGLAEGATAFALVKASSIIVAIDLPPARLSARNQLTGVVTHVEHGAVNDEIVMSLGDGDDALTIAAIVTSVSARSLGLDVGARATALFKASSVIVGVPG